MFDHGPVLLELGQCMPRVIAGEKARLGQSGRFPQARLGRPRVQHTYVVLPSVVLGMGVWPLIIHPCSSLNQVTRCPEISFTKGSFLSPRNPSRTRKMDVKQQLTRCIKLVLGNELNLSLAIRGPMASGLAPSRPLAPYTLAPFHLWSLSENDIGMAK